MTEDALDVSVRIALVNCRQAHPPNCLSIIGPLSPEDALPISFSNSASLGTLNLDYSRELHDALSSAMRLIRQIRTTAGEERRRVRCS